MSFFEQVALWGAGFFALAAIASGIMAAIDIRRRVFASSRSASFRSWFWVTFMVPLIGWALCLGIGLTANVKEESIPYALTFVGIIPALTQLLVLGMLASWLRWPEKAGVNVT